MDVAVKKQNGVHYTPPGLASFLARQLVSSLNSESLDRESISILDPACGDGALLVGLVNELNRVTSAKLSVFGFEIDLAAADEAMSRLAKLDCVSAFIEPSDFLESDSVGFEAKTNQFDLVIANPPYVRTQMLGESKSQALANKFNLTGRVDLYHAFTVAIGGVLKPGGSLGLLTSNRFLSVKSGAAMRCLLRDEFDLQQIFDLGDTRLFEAAVLPAIIVGRKKSTNSKKAKTSVVKFDRIYVESQSADVTSAGMEESDQVMLYSAIEDSKFSGRFETARCVYSIERGELVSMDTPVWTLGNSKTRRWLKSIRANQSLRFADVAEIKVGIKTTADSVFIREDWSELRNREPESELLLPLITHHDASRWSIDAPQKKVLYPYDLAQQKRSVVELKNFPRTREYLFSNRERLEGRKYVVNSGRKWFEIWVPHQPADWAKPKLVWPDISQDPKFFFDASGAVVNGDCYWIKLREGMDFDWLYLMLAVANSEVATTFYDTVFHNKLYAGRRRFMTQYVKEFPLPDLESKIGQQIVLWTKRLVVKPTMKLKSKVEVLVQKAFGF